jgi:ABC-type multidrug transport system fused ATPase/permease subunit
VKKNVILLVSTFFLVKGKFIFVLFLKKLALLSLTGLGKRYMVEKVFMENFKLHFLNHLKLDIQRLTQHAKANFKNFPLMKKLLTLVTFIGSLGFVGKFMGGMLAVKVFIAKIWSFLLAIFLKVGGAVVYFFTDYLWSSWLAPIIEVLVFSWFLSWIEKVPYLSKGVKKIYAFFIYTFGWIEYYLDKIFHRPMKRMLSWVVKKIQKYIYKFMGYKPRSLWKKFKQERILKPNAYRKIKIQREKRLEEKKKTKALSGYERLKKKRKEYKEKTD